MEVAGKKVKKAKEARQKDANLKDLTIVWGTHEG